MQLEAAVETLNEKVVSLENQVESLETQVKDLMPLKTKRCESCLLQHKQHSFERDRKNAAVFPKKLHRVGGNSCQTKRIYLRSGESGEIHNQNQI